MLETKNSRKVIGNNVSVATNFYKEFTNGNGFKWTIGYDTEDVFDKRLVDPETIQELIDQQILSAQYVGRDIDNGTICFKEDGINVGHYEIYIWWGDKTLRYDLQYLPESDGYIHSAYSNLTTKFVSDTAKTIFKANAGLVSSFSDVVESETNNVGVYTCEIYYSADGVNLKELIPNVDGLLINKWNTYIVPSAYNLLFTKWLEDKVHEITHVNTFIDGSGNEKTSFTWKRIENWKYNEYIGSEEDPDNGSEIEVIKNG